MKYRPLSTLTALAIFAACPASVFSQNTTEATIKASYTDLTGIGLGKGVMQIPG